ncbi:MAG: nucleotide sugar dehydrogenase [Candidatus Helarchaeota archaeon]
MSNDFELFKDKIDKKAAKVTIIGLGFVGLPTALFLADGGYEVIGIDINKEKVSKIKNKVLPFNENSLRDLFSKIMDNNKLTVYSEIPENYSSDVWMIAVATPLSKDLKPDLSNLISAIKDIIPHIKNNCLIIIESTITPGTTMEIIRPMLDELRKQYSIWLAHCPERILVGNVYNEFKNLSRVIGGIDNESTELAYHLYKNIINGELYKTDSTTAELVKVAENTYRNINIAFANQLALICNKFSRSAYDIIELANKHPRVNILRPGCGVGGHCIPKDPVLLYYASIGKNFDPILIKVAREINEEMPSNVIRILEEYLKNKNLKLEGLKIAVLGVSYKGDSDDIRNTPVEKIIKNLVEKGAIVSSFDPYIKEGFSSNVANSIIEAIKDVKIILITTGHSVFKDLDFKEMYKIACESPIIFDTRGIIDVEKARLAGFEVLTL